MKNNIAQKIKKFYDLMLDENLSEMEYREDDFYIYLKRKTKNSSSSAVADELPRIAPAAVSPKEEKSLNAAPLQSIKSPINGVFYRASSPKSPPFVNEGDVVEPGKTLCIIEAMKVMNEIKADRRMKILKIFLENGKPVNQGQDLFAFE